MKNILPIILALLSLPMFAQEFPIATGAYSQTYPSAAFANGKYYDAFLDKSTGSSSYGFHGKFIEQDGTVLPDDIGIINPTYNLSFMHEIIWGQTNYLFVWSRGVSGYDRDAYGQLVGEDGYPEGNFFAVSVGNTESASFVEAAFDGVNYFVVWQEGLPNSGSLIRAQFVSQEGQLIGNNFSVRPEGLSGDVSQIYPDVEFDGEKYLVVWDDNRSGNRDVYGQFVSVDGELLGDDIAIANNNADQLLVQLAFGGSNFYAVWADERLSSNDKSIYGQLIGLDGELLGENLVISPQTNSEGRTWPDVAASNGEYLVVWDQEWLEYKKGMDSTDDTEALKYEAAGVELHRPTVWYDIYARKISFQGEVASDEMAICTVDYHQQDCDVISDGEDFLVSWSDSRNGNQYYDIYGYIVEGSEMPLLPVISPDTINFVNMNQFFIGGEDFSIFNPNDVEISIDDIYFNADEGKYWYLTENITYPLLIDGGATVELTVNLDLPVGGNLLRSFDTDTLIAQTMNSEVMLMLNIDEALIDTIYTTKKEYTLDSLYFHTVDQAIFGQSFGIINRHWPGVYISSVWTSGPYGYWEISSEYALPFTIYMGDTLDFHVSTMLPVLNEFMPDETAVDTLWFASYGKIVYSFPIYYETAVLDSIWTSIDDQSLESSPVIFPNPASQFINVTLQENEIIEKVEFLDFKGSMLKSFNADSYGKTLNTHYLKNGMYLLRVYTNKKIYTDKIIIKH